MNRTLLRRGLRAAGVLGVIAGSVVGLAPQPASAKMAQGTNQIAAAGSDTTEAFMEAYLAGKTTATNGTTTWNIATYNIPALGGTKVVPGDADCPNGQITYGPAVNAGTGVGAEYTSTSATTFPLPNGSSAGRRFLVDERIANPDAACVDIARSSSGPPLAGETSTFEYYAFGARRGDLGNAEPLRTLDADGHRAFAGIRGGVRRRDLRRHDQGRTPASPRRPDALCFVRRAASSLPVPSNPSMIGCC